MIEILIVFTILSFASTVLWYFEPRRSSEDVFQDLMIDATSQSEALRSSGRILEIVKILGVVGVLLFVTFFFWRLNYSIKLALATVIFVVSLAILLRKYLRQRKVKEGNLDLEQILPLFMERLVMTIESGHDVISGIKIVTEKEFTEASKKCPLTKIFKEVISYTEEGLAFTESLRTVSNTCSTIAVKHVLIHLALAYEQGGELILPLRELSDATQAQYQEEIEEQIAKLPVKATVPLILIFAGLIILFVTPPILQVLSLTSGGAL